MRIVCVHIAHFRCLKELEMSLGDVTVLVGANGTGKSSLLHALRWFFEGGRLEEEDHAGHQTNHPVTVGVTFSDFDEDDREALGSYVLRDEATFWRTWSAVDGEKLTGKGRAFPLFDAVRRHEKATPKREAYKLLCEEHAELALPKANSAAAVDANLVGFEGDHLELLEDSQINATHLFGFTGGARLNGRFDFVLVPAIADPEAETRDARGTLLRQLLDRALGEQSEMRAKLVTLGEQLSKDVQAIVDAEGGPALVDLADGVTNELERLVPGGRVLLEAQPTPIRVPELSVDIRVADGELETAVGHQGHGFQRALLIAVVQRLAALRPSTPAVDDAATVEDDTSDESKPHVPSLPTLFLALEEPELYQHPLQARHFAATLATLAEESEGSMQIAYATHSEHFVDPSHYQRLRRFQRRVGCRWPEAEIAQATVDRVARRLAGVCDADEVEVRVRLTLRRQVAEAVFAKAVLILEGKSDAGFMHGLADRHGGFDAMGVAVVAGNSKRQLLVPWAILAELGVPSYVVFDGDAGIAARMLGVGKSEQKAKAAEAHERQETEIVLSTLGGTAELLPSTTVTPAYAMFADTLETEAASWDGFTAAAEAASDELGDWRGKSEDVYRQVAAQLGAEPPKPFRDIIANVRKLVE